MPSIPARRAALALAAAIAASPATGGELDALAFRHIGPLGNRVTAVAGVPGEPGVYYAGAASGGVFKSLDGGVRWQPIFDATRSPSIGDLAVAASDANVVWVGTGESFIRSNVSIGDGVYRSTDAGRTWRHRGLEGSGRIARLAIDPRDPEIVYAAALGHLYGPQEERGLYRTGDGGASWERVLFVDSDTGGVDVVVDPVNPRNVFAATWQMSMSTSGRTSGGPGSGLYRSRDRGLSWERLEGRGLPHGPWGRIGLEISPADPDRVWALIETSSNRDFAPSDPFQGVLWRSDDGGDSWRMINADNTLTQRPLYYTRLVAAPDDRDEVTFLAVQQSISHDGGRTIEAQNSGWDHHDLWIDPADPERRASAHDGGVSISVDRGASWFRAQLPNAQMYHVATDDRIPYFVYGNRQDGSTAVGPSRTLDGDGEIPVGAWRSVGGCEVGFALPVPRADPEYVWAGCYDGILELHHLATGHTRDVSVWPLAIESRAAEELDYRPTWNAPLTVSPHDERTVYYGSQFLHRTDDLGRSWRRISPDLTGADPEWMRRAGGLTLDDAGPTIAPSLSAIAESPLTAGELWVGTNDGRVQLSRDGGATWREVGAAIPGLPANGTVSNIEPSRHAAGRAYLTVDRHREGDTATWVFRTDDWGATWRSLRGDLPQTVFAYAHCVREDPERPGLLYLGTENGLWVSLDDGAAWRRLGGGLAPAPVYWIEVQERFADLVVATYGRGFWILDDLTPLRALEESAAAGPYLFAPRPAWRFLGREGIWRSDEPAAGTDPDYGATLHYRLAEEAGSVALRLRAGDGALARELDELPAAGGLHRVVWDLRETPTARVLLRTPPDENRHVEVPPEGRRLSDGGRFSVLAPPGRYAVELVVDGEVAATRELEVRRDPRSLGTPEDLEAQLALARELRERIAGAADAIHRIEALRAQLEELGRRWAELRPDAGPELGEAIDALDAELRAIEGVFFDLRLTGARQDGLRWGRRLYARLTYLARRATMTDERPTAQQLEVHRLLGAELEEALARLEGLLADELPAFNRLAADQGAAGLIVAEPAAPAAR